MIQYTTNPDTKGIHKGMTDIMLDIETDGRNALKNSIVQLAAKKFNLLTGELGHDLFVANLKPLPDREQDPATMQWWSRQDKKIREGVFENPLDPSLVMNTFADWCYPQNTLCFWGKPTHFDYVFVQSYFDELKIPNPFHYRIARDMNSFIAGLHHPKERPSQDEIIYKRLGGAHNALTDVINQISELLAHEKYGS